MDSRPRVTQPSRPTEAILSRPSAALKVDPAIFYATDADAAIEAVIFLSAPERGIGGSPGNLGASTCDYSAALTSFGVVRKDFIVR